jgi:hypothetical protein
MVEVIVDDGDTIEPRKVLLAEAGARAEAYAGVLSTPGTSPGSWPCRLKGV